MGFLTDEERQLAQDMSLYSATHANFQVKIQPDFMFDFQEGWVQGRTPAGEQLRMRRHMANLRIIRSKFRKVHPSKAFREVGEARPSPGGHGKAALLLVAAGLLFCGLWSFREPPKSSATRTAIPGNARAGRSETAPSGSSRRPKPAATVPRKPGRRS